jgi:DME family drug/metabolite transporter
VPEARGVVLVLAAALLWSAGGVGIKAVPEPPLAVACWRSGIAALTLLVVLRPVAWHWRPGFLVAVASYAACVTTFVVATKWTAAANAIFLQYSGVVWVLLLSPLVLREPLRGRDAAAVGVAFGGMALFFVGRLEPAARAGDVVAIVSGMCLAALVLALRRERDVGAEAAVVWGNVVTAVALAPFAGLTAPPAPASLGVLVLLGVFQMGTAYVLFVRGLRTVRATQAALLGMVEPVANPIWVFLALGERPRPLAVAGGLVVLGADAWQTRAAARAAATAGVVAPD